MIGLKRECIALKIYLLRKHFHHSNSCKKKYNIPRSHFFKYLQLRNFVKQNNILYPNSPNQTTMEKILLRDPHNKSSISYIYETLFQLTSTTTLEHIRSSWAEDLEIEITEEQWEAALQQIHGSSVCARHGLIQFKVIHRLHWSKQKLSKIFPNVDPSCDRCGRAPASLAHMFWSCTKLISYWRSIFRTLSRILQRPIDLDPRIAVLGIIKSETVTNRADQTMILFVCLLARRLILLNWKQKAAPTYKNLMRDIMKHLDLEKIRFSLKNKEEKFSEIWQPFINYFGDIDPKGIG